MTHLHSKVSIEGENENSMRTTFVQITVKSHYLTLVVGKKRGVTCMYGVLLVLEHYYYVQMMDGPYFNFAYLS